MADDSRIARVSRFSRIWWKSRADAGLSQEEMAIGLGVSKKTIQNWEKGISAPDLFQGSEWFRLLGLNPMPYYLEFVYPTLFSDFSPDKSDAEIEDALIHLIVRPRPRKSVSCCSLWQGSMEVHGLHCFRCLLRIAIPPCSAESPLHGTFWITMKCSRKPENLSAWTTVQPDLDILRRAVESGKQAAQRKAYGYTHVPEK